MEVLILIGLAVIATTVFKLNRKKSKDVKKVSSNHLGGGTGGDDSSNDTLMT